MTAIWNPYLTEAGPLLNDLGLRSQLKIKSLRLRYAWAIPNETAALAIKRHAPQGLIEVGAGSGYWKRFLEQFGILLSSFDIGGDTLARWSNRNWSEVKPGGPEVASLYPERALLIVKPNDVLDPKQGGGAEIEVSYAAKAFEHYRRAGGKTLIHVGLAFYHQEDEQGEGLSGEQRILGYTYVPDLMQFPTEWKLVEAVPIPTYDHTGWGPEQVYIFKSD